ncbi:MAG TPA: flagellar hook-length control protein FliK [Pseudobdellovibrionaceae bacterium]|nr:flagellar hook-length control protein FliK [Pseudobdellovibrionaceae bacterium]
MRQRSDEPVKPMASASNSRRGLPQDDASLPTSLRREDLGAMRDVASSTSPEFERAVEEVVSKMAELSEDETELRAEAMREFMLVMNREFGVEPEQMVKAYTQLSESELAASPDQTAKKVIQNLGLEPAQIPRAERLYREMLVKTGESMLQEKLAGATGLVALDIISRREMAAKQLESSISDLNAAFTQPQRPVLSQNSTGVVAKDEANQAYLDRLMMGMAAAGAVGASQAGNPVVAEIAGELQATGMMPQAANSGAARSSANSDLMTEMLKLRSQSAPAEISPDLNGEVAKATNEGSGLAAGLGLSALASMAAASGEADLGSAGDDSQGAELKSEFNVNEISRDASGAEFADTLQVKSNSTEKVATAVGTGAMLSANTSEQRSNGPELMRQAQLLVNQGGGEMKMQLRPEGLGEVHLKVKVENGQVQIQMLTESDSAKKAIEGSLDELRSGLAQSKLHVDAMKIEVGTDLAKQRFEQQQQESQRDQARQMAQNFMGQFREGRQSFHQSLGENRGWREYRPNRIADAPTPDAVVSASASARSASSSRRLDLVA